MLKVLVVEEVKELSVDSYVDGVCLLLSCSKQPTKNGGSFRAGKLSSSTGDIQFKAWSNSSAYSSLEKEDLVGKVVEVQGKIDGFGGVKSLILNQVSAVDLNGSGMEVSDFLSSKYDCNSYFETLRNTLVKKVSQNALDVFDIVIHDYESRFKTEFAAVAHHDNCKGGLVAHTLKMCRIASVVQFYPNILKKVGADLLYVGCALHDIGKVVEYVNGAVSPKGRMLSHTAIGIEMLAEYKNEICDIAGEDFYNGLLGIISGHHGEYGEPSRTVAAYVVHLIDVLDASMTGLDDKLGDLADDQLIYNNFKLS